jgi:large exoprotein involved in heme utilization and adhesion
LINTNDFFLRDGADIFANVIGQGTGGNVEINALQQITLEGTRNDYSEIFSSVETNAQGNAGSVTLNTQVLDVSKGSILSFTKGQGDASNLTINASDRISLDGSTDNLDIGFTQLNVQVQPDGVGEAGDLNLNTANLSLTGGSRILANTSGNGNAGNIQVNTGVLFLTNGSEIRADTANNNNAGNIEIETNQLTVSEGSQIATGTSGEGNAGDLTVRASEFIKLSGQSENQRSGLVANAIESSGNGGELTVNTEELTIEDGATITVGNFQTLDINEPGTGEAGNINIFANSVTLNDQGRIDAATQSETGEGANIILTVAEDITLENNSLISAQAFGDADGGNLTIDTNFIVAYPDGNNDIIASAELGSGGNINITAEALFGIEQRALNDRTNDINASSQFGLDGTVSIFTPDLNPVQGATELPSNVVEPEQTTEQACQANREAAAKNGLIVRGKGGIPATPDQPLTSQNLLINGEVNSASAIPEPIETSQGKIHLARGIKFTKDGGIILTPYPTNNAGERIPEIKLNCS